MGRHSITPMEFEYANGTGPIDNASPFLTATSSFGPGGGGVRREKRPHSVLETPTRSAFAAFNTPDRPHLREPQNERILFDSKPLSSIPAHIQNDKWQPRTPASVCSEFSSGAESPFTPGQDSDASATPGTQIIGDMGRLSTEDPQSKSPKKKNSDTTGRKLMNFFKGSPSPTKEKETRRAYSHRAEHRVMKKRSKSRSKQASVDGYDSESAQTGAAQQRKNGAEQPGYFNQAGQFFHWVEEHPNLPGVLSKWFQLLVNSLLGLVFMYILYAVWAGVQADIGIEASQFERNARRDIAVCSKEYRENHCAEGPSRYLEEQCARWEDCKNKDPRAVAKAQITARTFAKIFNNFVHEFSVQSMIFTALVLFGGLNLSNWAFSTLRNRHHQNAFEQWQQQQQPQFPPQQAQHQLPQPQYGEFYPPNTPHRQTSGGFGEGYTPYATPYTNMQGIGMGMGERTKSLPALPAPSAVEGERDGEKRKSGRRRLFA